MYVCMYVCLFVCLFVCMPDNMRVCERAFTPACLYFAFLEDCKTPASPSDAISLLDIFLVWLQQVFLRSVLACPLWQNTNSTSHDGTGFHGGSDGVLRHRKFWPNKDCCSSLPCICLMLWRRGLNSGWPTASLMEPQERKTFMFLGLQAQLVTRPSQVRITPDVQCWYLTELKLSALGSGSGYGWPRPQKRHNIAFQAMENIVSWRTSRGQTAGLCELLGAVHTCKYHSSRDGMAFYRSARVQISRANEGDLFVVGCRQTDLFLEWWTM